MSGNGKLMITDSALDRLRSFRPRGVGAITHPPGEVAVHRRLPVLQLRHPTPSTQREGIAMADNQTLQVQTHAHGAVPDEAMDLAVMKARSVLRMAPEPVLFARVKLTM